LGPVQDNTGLLVMMIGMAGLRMLRQEHQARNRIVIIGRPIKGHIMEKREEKLVTVVDALSEDIVSFAKRLVAQPSILGNEATVLEEMEKELDRLGFNPSRVPIDPSLLNDHPGFAPVPWTYEGRYNVIGTRPADSGGGKSALFNGHLDVVSPEPLAGWAHDPFGPMEKEGWLYGRGAGDMKAGIAAMTYAVRAIDIAGFGLAAPVTIETVIEEECSGNGALACRQAGLNAEAVLIPEPFGPIILTAQVGAAWFKVTLTGVPKHVMDTHGGVNAIEKCFPLIAALRRMEKALNCQVHPAFERIGHPANLNIGIFKSGDWPSTVPAKAEFHCRIGFLPGTAYDQIRQEVIRVITEAASEDPWLAANPPEVDFYGLRSEGHCLSPEMPAFRLLNSCHQSLTGCPAENFISTATTDLRAFVHFGKGQATCFGPVAENIHAENERVRIDSIIHTARVYALFLARWCGLVE
jgi:acetylornithine deacetylase